MATVLFICLSCVSAVELDVPYVETPDNIVELMLDMVSIQPGDYVIDLGTGDGRIVIAAAKRGATGLGVDLDPQRIKEAKQKASEAGVSDRVEFVVEDLFKSDISAATVVTLFLNSEVNMRLRPALFEQLKPGTRVVSHNFDMEDWQPDQQEELMVNNNNNFYIHDIYYWVVPADISGLWQSDLEGEQFQMNVNQKFQMIKVDMLINQQPIITEKAVMNGNEISIIGRNSNNSKLYTFNGSIDGNTIRGNVQISKDTTNATSEWSATRQSE